MIGGRGLVEMLLRALTRAPRAAPAKRVKVDVDLTSDTANAAAAAATTAAQLPRATSPPKSKAKGTTALASIFQPAAPSKGRWLPDVRRSASSAPGGAGHFVWGSPQPSTKVAAFGEFTVLHLPPAKPRAQLTARPGSRRDS